MTALITAEHYFFWFMFYSIAGWIYETLICSLEAKKFINRGFLNGPYCPIYGCGAVLDLLALGWIENPFLLFLAGALLDCTLEYFTSCVMEDMFHARWWDYSDKKLNINGRVCLLGAVVFGLFSMLLVKYVHPALGGMTAHLSAPVMHLLTALLFVIFVSDCVVTVSGFTGFNEKLKELTGALEQTGERVANRIHNSAAFETVTGVYEHFSKRLSLQQRRMLYAFPRLKSVSYNKSLSDLREFVSGMKKREKNKKRTDGK